MSAQSGRSISSCRPGRCRRARCSGALRRPSKAATRSFISAMGGARFVVGARARWRRRWLCVFVPLRTAVLCFAAQVPFGGHHDRQSNSHALPVRVAAAMTRRLAIVLLREQANVGNRSRSCLCGTHSLSRGPTVGCDAPTEKVWVLRHWLAQLCTCSLDHVGAPRYDPYEKKLTVEE